MVANNHNHADVNYLEIEITFQADSYYTSCN